MKEITLKIPDGKTLGEVMCEAVFMPNMRAGETIEVDKLLDAFSSSFTTEVAQLKIDKHYGQTHSPENGQVPAEEETPDPPYTIKNLADDLEKGEDRAHYIVNRRFSYEQFIFDIQMPKTKKLPSWVMKGKLDQTVVELTRDQLVEFLRELPENNQAFVRCYENRAGDMDVMDVTLFDVAKKLGMRPLTAEEMAERSYRIEKMLADESAAPPVKEKA